MDGLVSAIRNSGVFTIHIEKRLGLSELSIISWERENWATLHMEST